MLQPGFESFVGVYPLTTRYGLTPGEFARLANEEQHIGCTLHVLPVQAGGVICFSPRRVLHG